MNADSHPPQWGPDENGPGLPPDSGRAGGTSRSEFPSPWVAGGIALTLSCVALISVWAWRLDPDSDVWSALVLTVVIAGAPVVFLGIRLDLYLTAQREGRTIRLWPQDRSDAANWGLTLLWLNLGIAVFIASVSFDDLVFGGQIWDWLGNFES